MSPLLPGSPGAPGAAGGPAPAAQKAFDAALDAHDRGQLQQAETLYRQAIAADEHMTVAHNNLGMVLLELARLDEAVAALQRAIKLDPAYAEAYSNLGFALRKLHRDEEAAAAYERFLKLVPDVEEAPKIREWVAKVRAAAPPPPPPPPSPFPPAAAPPPPAPAAPQKKTIIEPPPAAELPVASVADEASELVALSPDGPAPAALAPDLPPAPAPSPAAAAEAAGGKGSQADSEAADFFGGAGDAEAPAAEKPTDLPPELEGSYSEAIAMFQDGEFEDAARLCGTILEKVPAHFHTLILAGRAEIARLDFTRASTLFQKASESKPTEPEAQFFLGQSYEKRGLIEEAQLAYQQCLQLAPDGPRAKRLAKWLERGQAEGKVLGGAAKCDFCLRAVPEQDLSLHDGKKACKNCLESLGIHGTTKKLKKTTQVFEAIKPPARKKSLALFVALGVVAVLAVAVAGGALAGVHRRPPVKGWLIALGLVKPPPPPQIVTPVEPGQILPESLAFGRLEDQFLQPLERLQLDVPLKVAWPGGATAPPDRAEPLKVEAIEKPEGMSFDPVGMRLAWTPGLAAPVEVPSSHKILLRAACGSKSAEASLTIRLEYQVSRPREIDLGLSETWRAAAAGLVLADLDGDDRPDLAAAAGTAGAGTLALLLSRGAAAGEDFGAVRQMDIGGAPMGLEARDFDGDGRVDLAWVDWATGRLCLARAPGGSAAGRIERLGAAGRFTEALALTDFNANGRGQFVTANRQDKTLTATGGDGQKWASVMLPETGAPYVVFALPEARHRKIVGLARSGGTGPGELTFYEMNTAESQAKWIALQKLPLPAGLVLAAAEGNFDGAGRQVAALLFGGPSGGLALVESVGGNRFALRPAGQLGEAAVGLAAADVNGDGRADLVAAAPGALRVLLSNGQGVFLPAARAPAAGLAGPVALWPARGRSPPRVAALSLRGRAMVVELPFPRAGRPTGDEP